MAKKVILSENAPKPIGPYSQAIMHGNLLFVSGQIAIDPVSGKLVTETLQDEVNQVLQNLHAVLAEAGMGAKNVVKCTIFLSDMSLFEEVNALYAHYFSSLPPARETVAVKGLPKGVNVEISCIAAL
ncbi:MAG: RidA family protein [Salibacteraceae bacterium]